MRRHAVIQKVALGLIAAQVVVGGIALWSSRREVVVAMATRPATFDTSLGEDRIVPGDRVVVLAPKLPWHSRRDLPRPDGRGTMEADTLLALPVETEVRYVRRPATPIYRGPSRADPVVAVREPGEALEVAAPGAVFLSGHTVADAWEYVVPVIEDQQLKGFVELALIGTEEPTGRDWLEASFVSLKAGRFEEALARAEEVARSPRALALQLSLTEALAHLESPVLHPDLEGASVLPPALIPYDPEQVIEQVTHLHAGELTERLLPRQRAAGEPLAMGHIAAPAVALMEEAALTGAAIGFLRMGTEVTVLDVGENGLKVSAEIAPPVRMEIDLSAALARGGRVLITSDEPSEPKVDEGYVWRDSVAMIPPTARGFRTKIARLEQEGKVRDLLERERAADALEPVSTAQLQQRLELSWRQGTMGQVSETAAQLWGRGTLGGILEAAELLEGCSGPAGCRAMCGRPLAAATGLARTAPPAGDRSNTRHLFLRLRGQPAVEELALSVVAVPTLGRDPCGPAVSPRIASFLYRPLSEADHELWLQLPELPLHEISVVTAPAAQALEVLEESRRPRAAEDRPELTSQARTFRLPRQCDAVTAQATPP